MISSSTTIQVKRLILYVKKGDKISAGPTVRFVAEVGQGFSVTGQEEIAPDSRISNFLTSIHSKFLSAA